MSKRYKIIECPRDAIQSFSKFIPMEQKVEYLQALLQVGFDTLDCGSFVSYRRVPQLKDTAKVLEKLEVSETQTKLSTVACSYRGALQLCDFEQISYLGFPFSISEVFQKENTGQNLQQAFNSLEQINNLIETKSKKTVVYLSMAFGNLYNEKYNLELVYNWVKKLNNIGIKTITLADTVGLASLQNIETLLKNLIKNFKNIEFGVHFHTQYNDAPQKILTAFESGCTRFESTIKGLGGCPFSNKKIGNTPTEKVVSLFNQKKVLHNVKSLAFETAYNHSLQIFQ